MIVAGSNRAAIGRLTLGAALRARRRERGLTMAQMGKLAGLTESYVSDVERGRKLPSLEALDGCAVALETTVVELLRQQYPWDDAPPPPNAGPPPDGRRRPES